MLVYYNAGKAYLYLSILSQQMLCLTTIDCSNENKSFYENGDSVENIF